MSVNVISVSLAISKEERKTADKIVEEYHSYVNSSKTVGRTLKYLIWNDSDLIGTFWVGSGFKPTPKDILNFFNMSQKEFDIIFNEVADNKRFAMKDHVKNAGTKAIKIIRNRVKNDWMEKYGDNLRAIITTVGDGKKGSVYLADNWSVIGKTAGLPDKRKSVSMKWNSSEEISSRYVLPTGENKKTILITTKLK